MRDLEERFAPWLPFSTHGSLYPCVRDLEERFAPWLPFSTHGSLYPCVRDLEEGCLFPGSLFVSDFAFLLMHESFEAALS